MSRLTLFLLLTLGVSIPSIFGTDEWHRSDAKYRATIESLNDKKVKYLNFALSLDDIFITNGIEVLDAKTGKNLPFQITEAYDLISLKDTSKGQKIYIYMGYRNKRNLSRVTKASILGPLIKGQALTKDFYVDYPLRKKEWIEQHFQGQAIQEQLARSARLVSTHIEHNENGFKSASSLRTNNWDPISFAPPRSFTSKQFAKVSFDMHVKEEGTYQVSPSIKTDYSYYIFDGKRYGARGKDAPTDFSKKPATLTKGLHKIDLYFLFDPRKNRDIKINIKDAEQNTTKLSLDQLIDFGDLGFISLEKKGLSHKLPLVKDAGNKYYWLNGLEVIHVNLSSLDGTELKWQYGNEKPIIGSNFNKKLPFKGQMQEIRIERLDNSDAHINYEISVKDLTPTEIAAPTSFYYPKFLYNDEQLSLTVATHNEGSKDQTYELQLESPTFAKELSWEFPGMKQNQLGFFTAPYQNLSIPLIGRSLKDQDQIQAKSVYKDLTIKQQNFVLVSAQKLDQLVNKGDSLYVGDSKAIIYLKRFTLADKRQWSLHKVSSKLLSRKGKTLIIGPESKELEDAFCGEFNNRDYFSWQPRSGIAASYYSLPALAKKLSEGYEYVLLIPSENDYLRRFPIREQKRAYASIIEYINTQNGLHNFVMTTPLTGAFDDEFKSELAKEIQHLADQYEVQVVDLYRYQKQKKYQSKNYRITNDYSGIHVPLVSAQLVPDIKLYLAKKVNFIEDQP
ncbi:MAG: hypothetical protein MK193_08365 [Lentisphaeria bacterium]|nr:hypothetical protein [Lentisphaeria bacterium]